MSTPKFNLLAVISEHVHSDDIAALAFALLGAGHDITSTVAHLADLLDGTIDLHAVLPEPWGSLGEVVDGPLLRLALRPIVTAISKREG